MEYFKLKFELILYLINTHFRQKFAKLLLMFAPGRSIYPSIVAIIVRDSVFESSFNSIMYSKIAK